MPSRPGRPRPAQLIAAVAVTLAVVGALDLLGQTASTEVPARTAVPAETAVVRVGAGETVWDVARRVAPESDPRAVVDQIRQLNRMVGSAVEPGEQLQVPDGR
ncbi:MAG: LysM peptidoglycan-binding domain-containing protein [Pseudonocardiaceae bacterium]